MHMGAHLYLWFTFTAMHDSFCQTMAFIHFWMFSVYTLKLFDYAEDKWLCRGHFLHFTTMYNPKYQKIVIILILSSNKNLSESNATKTPTNDEDNLYILDSIYTLGVIPNWPFGTKTIISCVKGVDQSTVYVAIVIYKSFVLYQW